MDGKEIQELSDRMRRIDEGRRLEMAIQIAVGDESFDEIRNAGFYYVDKTDLLYELAAQRRNKVTLFTRPRRFGKTLGLSMMESFFDINRDSRNAFRGLDVTRHEDFCKEWMN